MEGCGLGENKDIEIEEMEVDFGDTITNREGFHQESPYGRSYSDSTDLDIQV